MKTADSETLERLVDAYGLADTLATLAEIAREKAAHIATNWQESGRPWELAARTCERASEARPVAMVSP